MTLQEEKIGSAGRLKWVAGHVPHRRPASVLVKGLNLFFEPRSGIM